MGNETKLGQESPQIDFKKSKKKRKRDKEKERGEFEGDNVQLQDQPEENLHHQPLNVRMEVINDRFDRTLPVVGYFPSRYDPQKASAPSVQLYRNAQRARIEKSTDEKVERRKGSERMELVVSPPGANVEFVGTSYKGEAAAPQFCTYTLGVFDKETQSLKIMPIAGNKIFRLEPRLRGSDAADKEPPEVENVELSAEQKEAKRRETTLRYSAKKNVLQLRRMQILREADKLDGQDELNQRNDFSKVNKEALESTSAHSARNIPPHNMSATTPQEAYPLEKIILTGEWGFLDDLSNVLRGGEKVTSEAYPTFVCNRVHKLQGIQDEEERNKCSCIFSYITHLIKFKDLHGFGVQSAKNHRFPSILRQRFFDMFSPESRRLPDEKLGLLISYVLVLTLYADDFRSDPADITKDLKMNPITVRDYYKNLGCKLVNENNVLLVTLPIPLKFPDPLRGKKRR